MVEGLAKGKGRAILAPTRLIGKDAKIASLVRETHKEGQDGAESAFDAKKIGKKPVFRPILTSPFTVQWPSITPVYADVILNSLLELLQRKDLQQHFQRENAILPRQSSRKTKEKLKRRRLRMVREVLKQNGVSLPPADAFVTTVERAADTRASERTPFLFGINSITRHLETQIRIHLRKSDEASTSSTKIHDPTYIFVCLSDIDPPALVSHFPLLVSTFNAVLKKHVILISLPERSEKHLAEIVNLRRCSCISIDTSTVGGEVQGIFKSFGRKIKDAKLTPTRLEWLETAIESLQANGSRQLELVDPQIKHLRSSAPLDMNAVKMNKREGRVERKATRRDGKKKMSSISKALAVKKPEKLTTLQRQQSKAKRQLKHEKSRKGKKGKKMPVWQLRKERREKSKSNAVKKES